MRARDAKKALMSLIAGRASIMSVTKSLGIVISVPERDCSDQSACAHWMKLSEMMRAELGCPVFVVAGDVALQQIVEVDGA